MAPIRATARVLGAALKVFIGLCVLNGAMLALVIAAWAVGLFDSPAYWDARHLEWRIEPSPNDPALDYPGLSDREVIDRRLRFGKQAFLDWRREDQREIVLRPVTALEESVTLPRVFDVYVLDPDERIEPAERFLGRYTVVRDREGPRVVRLDDPRDAPY